MTTQLIDTEPTHLADKLNWLRAGVLGANDGIVSVAGLVMGVAGAQTNSTTLLLAGIAGLVSGALSMAGGEYVSVSSQSDTEIAELAKQRQRLAENPIRERDALADLYRSRGVSSWLAREVADELSANDALSAHAELRLGIRADEQTNPWSAAFASFFSFAAGALIPLILMVATPAQGRVIATMIGVEIALALTGYTSARLGGASCGAAVVRNMLVGTITMGITYGVGMFFNI